MQGSSRGSPLSSTFIFYYFLADCLLITLFSFDTDFYGLFDKSTFNEYILRWGPPVLLYMHIKKSASFINFNQAEVLHQSRVAF
jgi:hypothetical protein